MLFFVCIRGYIYPIKTWDCRCLHRVFIKFYVYAFLAGLASNFSLLRWMRSLLIPSYRSVPTWGQDEGRCVAWVVLKVLHGLG